MDTPAPRKPYPTDVTDEEWALVAPYLALLSPAAPQRRHDLREVSNALRWIVRAGAPWRMLPTTFPPWEAVYQHTQRWLAAGVFETMAHGLRVLLRWIQAQADDPTAIILDSRTLRSTRPPTGSPWRSSSCPTPSGASCCCPAAGWSSAASPGRAGSGDWSGTTNACRQRWPAFTLWRLPA